MLTCNDCIHSSVCTPYNTPNDEYPNIGDCPHFKNKANYVEVVRCKDCKHYEIHQPIHKKVCEKNDGHLIPMKPDDFCSYGEREESEVRE